jgi:hypothetical protein
MAGAKKALVFIFVIVALLLSRPEAIFSQTAKTVNKELKYFGVNYRDPFLSFIPEEKKESRVEKVTPPDLKLQGIVWGADRPQAIINNTVLTKGDKILGAQIIDIEKKGVVFVYKEEQFFLDRISGMVKSISEVK